MRPDPVVLPVVQAGADTRDVALLRFRQHQVPEVLSSKEGVGQSPVTLPSQWRYGRRQTAQIELQTGCRIELELHLFST